MTARTGGARNGRGRPGRVARRDWIEAAYQELARGGERAVGINALAARLGVTKGSFYWHFNDRAELMRALLDRWAHERTDEILGLALGSTADPRERLRRIQTLGREIAPIDRAMRLWAQHDPAAEEAVRHADRALLQHIAACLEELGFEAGEARLRAVLMLRVWVGGYLVPDPPPDLSEEPGADASEVRGGGHGDEPGGDPGGGPGDGPGDGPGGDPGARVLEIFLGGWDSYS